MSTMSNEPVASARQQRVEVTGIPGWMTTKTGGETSAETSKAWDGGSLTPEVMAGPAEIGNVTVTKLYRARTHGAILRDWKRRVGRLRTTISVWDTDPDLGPVGQPTVYPEALLTRVTIPDYDASSSDPSSFELEFTVGSEA